MPNTDHTPPAEHAETVGALLDSIEAQLDNINQLLDTIRANLTELRAKLDTEPPEPSAA